MELDTTQCGLHNAILEIYCKSCHAYLCPKCIIIHATICGSPNYCHIIDYVNTEIMQKIDKIIVKHGNATKEEKSQITPEIIEEINGLSTKCEILSESFASNINTIENLLTKLKGLFGKKKIADINYLENLMLSIEQSREKINCSIKKDKTKDLLRNIIMLENFANQLVAEKQTIHIPSLLGTSIEKLKEISLNPKKAQEDLINLKSVMFTQGIIPFICDWKFDEKLLPDNLVLDAAKLYVRCKNRKTINYAVGDTPISEGKMAFELVGEFKQDGDGFGIIEKEMILGKKDKNTEKLNPDIQKHLIGMVHKNEIKNIQAIKNTLLVHDKTYKVYVDMINFEIEIWSKLFHLKGTLIPGKSYVPIVICGGNKSQFTVKPIQELTETWMSHEEINPPPPPKKEKKDEKEEKPAEEEDADFGFGGLFDD